ncbi:MalM family protein [Marinobacter sp. BGYM27]|uniref:MalM family protein n=1 Tax=Marinobacter sp. BGYM27 TaxID=2975597 RepID=UPI0021A744B7|nr:MalM family protein [Marinobacter sp. BGYM27]MDG5500548.1 MalM family protein [Marinobacter sp. BGYM27]
MANSRLTIGPAGIMLVAALIATAGPLQSADRYFTWVDENGHVQHTLIQEEDNPVEERAEAVREEKSASSATDVDQPRSSASKQKETASEPAGANEPAASDDEASTAKNGPAAAEFPKSAGDQLVTEPVPEAGEQAPISDAPLPQQAQPAAAAPEAPANQAATPATSGADAEPSGVQRPTNPDYNLKNYPDGDELAKKGFLREGDALPYYTWRDAQGNVRVDYYRPEPGFEKKKSAAEPPELSEAMVLDGSRGKVDNKMSAEAIAVLELDQSGSLMDEWMANCCVGLPVKDLVEWDDSREFQVDLDDMAPEYLFSTGESAYRLMKLPASSEAPAFVVRIRSYVQSGVFVPTLVFLDKGMATRRLVTEVAFDYEPESWHSHGYIEARVPVFPAEGDRWLLVMSRGADQRDQTVVETDTGPLVIPHKPTGLLGVSQLH